MTSKSAKTIPWGLLPFRPSDADGGALRTRKGGERLEHAAAPGDDGSGERRRKALTVPRRLLGQRTPMEPVDFPDAQRLERFRDYLALLARLQLGSHPTGRVDPSDVVQQTLMEAYEKRDEFRGETSGAHAAWLRKMLARNVADALRAQG
jgi:hypothetical protein